MAIRTFAFVLTVGLAVFGITPLGPTASAPDPADYAWAASCRKCHQPIYEAWARTKHASALDRLGSADQEKECVGCHVTGPKTRVADGTTVLNRGVQCEACHGAAKAHVADPATKAGLTRVPAAAVCEECHSSRSPRFKGFYYDAMAFLSHRTR